MTNGSLLNRQLDEYRLEVLLGRGGMARVYRALDVRLKRYVAIKVIDAVHRADSDYARRFELEAQAIARLSHPHIVQLYRYGQTDDVLYMAMQYIDGMDLGTLMQSYWDDGEFMDPEDIVRIVRQICQALDYVHGQGVIHRDIKPSNIMLDRHGNAHLADFGLVLMTSVGTRGEIFGTPHYIAPEQAISSAHAVPQSDLYAIAVILYEMFTGVLPFDAPDPLEVAMLHMTEEPRPPHELRPGITPEVEAVILKALSKEPEDRYQTGATLTQALEEALQAKPAPLKRTSRTTVYARVSSAASSLPLPPDVPPAPPPLSDEMPVQDEQPTVTAQDEHPTAIVQDERPTVTAQDEQLTKPTRDELPIVTTAPAPLAANASQPPETVIELPARRRPPWLIVVVVGGGILLSLICVLLVVFGPLRDRIFVEDATLAPSPMTSEVAENSSTPEMIGAAPTPTPTAKESTPAPETTIPASPTPATSTPEPTATPTPTSTPQATAVPPRALVLRGDEDTLWIINRGEEALPLTPLLLKAGKKSLTGDVWGLEILEAGACVVALKNKEADPPQPCTQVGTWTVAEKKDAFWTKNFDIHYGDTRVSKCEEKTEECWADIVLSNP